MTPHTSMLIVSYERDFPWLEFCFRSIERHCNGFHEIVLAIPDKDEKAFKKMYGRKKWKFDCDFKVRVFEEGALDPHMAALYCRCCADEICEGDIILHHDSDCFWICPTDPDIYLDRTFGVKPILVYRPFELRDGKWYPSHWKESTDEALGFNVEWEVMARHPSLYHRAMLPAFRSHVEQVHNMSFYDYLLPRKRHAPGNRTFSEFCAMGAYAFYFQRNRYHWILEGTQELIPHLWQCWSFDGVNHPKSQAKLKEFDLL